MVSAVTGRLTAKNVGMGIGNLLKNVMMGIPILEMAAAMNVKSKRNGFAILVFNQHTAFIYDLDITV